LYSRGVVPVQRYMSRGLRVGLGTDFAGGASCAMLTAVRGAVLTERTVDFVSIEREKDDSWPSNNHCEWDVDFVYGYYLATVWPGLLPLISGGFGDSARTRTGYREA
jgi:hypothetical protein